jgi:hypothetical protein
MSFTEIRKERCLPLSAPVLHPTAEEVELGRPRHRLLDQVRTPYGFAPVVGTHTVGELRQRLLHEYLMIHGKSHYEILGVTPKTPTSQIEEAVLAKLASFPIRMWPGIRACPRGSRRLDAVRAAITQAGRILCVPAERTDYDQNAVTTQTATVDPLGPNWPLAKPCSSSKAERFEEALEKFEAAVSARPDQALYHAYLGWADFVAHGPTRPARPAIACTTPWPWIPIWPKPTPCSGDWPPPRTTRPRPASTWNKA